MYRALLVEREGWRPDDIKGLIVNDLRVMALKECPPEPGDAGPRKITTQAQYEAAWARAEGEKNSWLS